MENSKKISLVFITDEGYAEPTAVAIMSAILNKKQSSKYEINILTYNISKSTETKFKTLSSLDSIEINIIKIPNLDKFKNIKQSRYITPTALLKFDLPLLFPKKDKILYLDGDIIVQNDLSDFYNTDISEYYAAVVEDAVTLTPKNYHRSSVCLNDKYFNSGVLLFNLNKLRQDNCPQKLLDWRMKNGEFYMDQDALNEVLGHNVLYSSCWFNFITFYPDKHNNKDLTKLYGFNVPKDKIDMYKHAVILHYAGVLKPWKNKMIYLSTLYKYYLGKTNFNKKIKYLPADNERKIIGNTITVLNDAAYKTCLTFSDKVIPLSEININFNYKFENFNSIYTNYVPPIFEKSIPIVYSSNNNYVPYLTTSIKSLIEHASPDKNYDIVILENQISDKNKQKILTLTQNNISIRFFNVTSYISDCQFFLNRYFSAETYYRIFVAEIFRLYEKIIYLDSDVLVLENIAELYEINLKNNLIAAANDIVSYSHRINNYIIFNIPRKTYTQEILGIDDTRYYFQAGVLVFNIKEMLKNNITQKFLDKIEEIKNPVCHDQDILNSVCYKKVLYIPQKWNFYAFFNPKSLERTDIMNRYNDIPNSLKTEYEYAYKHPNIIHFAGNEKVWFNESIDFGNLWWKYAQKTPFYKILLKNKKMHNQAAKKTISPKNIILQIFSVRNLNERKLITILGFKIKIKSSKLKNRQQIRNIENQINDLKRQISPLKDIYKFKTKSINQKKIDYFIKKYDEYGITLVKRNPRIIVSLTSFPDRIYDIQYTLYSLLTQEFKPDEVILWLAEEEFPNGETSLPQNILKLKENGLSIKWCKNIKSYKKLIPALKEFPNDIIVTADDDIYYTKDWLKCLVERYLESDRHSIIAHRCHRIKFNKYNQIEDYKKWDKCIKNSEYSYQNFFTGAGGVLYPPNTLNPDCINEKMFETLCPTADDIWFWGMAVLNGTKIAITQNPMELTYSNPYRELLLNGDNTLYSVNGKLGLNNKQLKALLTYYPNIKRNINQERFCIKNNNI